MNLKNRSVQLTSAVTEQLLDELTEGKYRHDNKLPAEVEIAQDLGVSRTVLRDSVAVLEREGFVTRKWGVGTLINRHVLSVKSRLDIEEEFLTMVRRCGYEPEIVNVKVYHDKAASKDANRLGIAVGKAVLRIHRTILANKTPAIFCIDTIPEDFIREKDYREEELSAPIFEFIERRCKKHISTDLTDIHAANATGEIQEALQVKENEAVLFLDELGYDMHGTPVLQSDEYYREGVLMQTILRKKVP